ncbi:hypothetical protein [Enhygromyxa salina]|uniref:Uncharacterized protein n=1 Tax=Enhygromyxa salina TaxID=215803 RepID=A0A2S9YVB8_9BACT|nr:hypothetical protein [Enhygromyxa salina]PRQ08989.1 hypothetical protein ENSA7_12600 [Enhygromyxa salina]
MLTPTRRTICLTAALLSASLSCSDTKPPPVTDEVTTPTAAPVDSALLAELLGESVEVEGERVTADAILVRLAFEPLIRGTGPASLQLVQSQGYRLSGVSEREPLWLLGLREGDVLTLVDGAPIIAREHELRSQWAARPTDVAITYLRGDQTHVLRLQIRPGAAWKSASSTTRDRAERLAERREVVLERHTDDDSEPEPELELSQSLRCAASRDESDSDLGRCELERSAFEDLLSNPSSLARSMRVVPSVSDGQTDGFKLYGIRSRSLPGLLGLKNGDRVTAINGHALTSLDSALETYTKLRDASELVISLVRKDQRHRLTITLVDAFSDPPEAASD